MPVSRRPLRELFLRQSINRLRHDYLPKIRRCLDQLSTEQIWWRPNDESNSIGNLILHLAGNLRQWVVVGLPGLEDDRQRDVEFATRDGLDADQLFARLEQTVRDAEDVFGVMTETDLRTEVVIQGFRTTGLGVVYHVVEHFSGHTGQILWITKMLRGEDLRFYEL